MNDTVTSTAERVICDPADHDWQVVGRCTHGFGGQIMFNAVKCAKCGIGGHGRLRGYACPRRAEGKAERVTRIERQIAECPVWDAMPADLQAKLRG